MMFKTFSALSLLAAVTVLQAQAKLVTRDDPSIQAVSGGVAPLDPTTLGADQGDNDKWGWGNGRWGYGYPFYGYGYGYRPFYGGWWY